MIRNRMIASPTPSNHRLGLLAGKPVAAGAWQFLASNTRSQRRAIADTSVSRSFDETRLRRNSPDSRVFRVRELVLSLSIAQMTPYGATLSLPDALATVPFLSDLPTFPIVRCRLAVR
jgi:hypothetical protein